MEGRLFAEIFGTRKTRVTLDTVVGGEAKNIVDLEMLVEGSLEAAEVLGSLRAPLNLAESGKTRKEHILKVLRSQNILGPEICLDAKDILPGRLIGNKLIRFKTINLLYRELAAYGIRLLHTAFLVTLIEIKVAVCGRSQDCREAHSCRFYAGIAIAPGHYGSALAEFALENLIPADNLTALACEIVLNALGDIVLEILLCSMGGIGHYAKGLDESLTVRTLLPAVLRTLVSADMDVL
jgi:hypothetical protein